MKRALLFIILAAPLALHAEDWTTVDGKVYKNITVVSHDDGYVTILDDSGGAKLMMTELPAAVRQRFGFDPVKASACVAATEAAEQKDQTELEKEKQQADAVLAQAAARPAPPASPAGSTPPAPPRPSLPTGTHIQNGDFSHGDFDWQGDGETPQSFLQDHPALAANPIFHQGLIVPLNPTSWTRIYQTFTGDETTQYSIEVTYRLSPDLAPSKNAADYADILKSLQMDGYNTYQPFAGQPGEFFGSVGDPHSASFSMEVYMPKLGTSDVQTYQHSYPAIPPLGNPNFILAFPPGTGEVVILSAAVTSK